MACWCQRLPTLDTATRVVFLQHPREARVAVGTARMAHLCLPNSSLHVGTRWDEDPAVILELSNLDSQPILLFPGPNAPDILKEPPAGPVTLVVIDGTWSQAGKLVKRSPVLSALPRYGFVPPAASAYRIRKEPRADCVSTIEALAYVLGVLEKNPTGMLTLLDPFHDMVEFQVDHAQRLHQPRRRIKNRKAAQPSS
jgi:DTW domain-containing protein YfiP